MTRLLHIQCSPRLRRSASLEIAHSFIQRYQQQVPDTQVSTLDLWSLELPELDQTTMDAKYARLGGQPLNAGEQGSWGRLQELAAPPASGRPAGTLRAAVEFQHSLQAQAFH